MNRETGKSNLEGTRNTFAEIGEQGEKIAADGEAINNVLKARNYDGLDADDVAAYDTAIDGYNSDFRNATDEGVTAPTEETSEKAKSDISELEADKERVSDAKDGFSEAAGISEIGARNAEQGESQMERSIEEYNQIVDSSKEAISEAEGKSSETVRRVEGLF